MVSVFSEKRDGRAGCPEFTDEEIRLIRLWSLSDGSTGGQLSAQIAYFATPAVFGIYGLLTGSLVIVGVAFICTLLLLAWGLVATWQDRHRSGLMPSICAKVLAMLAAGEIRK